jgi:hypothetical protein
MWPDPEPQNCAWLTLNANGTVVFTNAHRNDWLTGFGALEVKTRMSRLNFEKPIRGRRLLSYVTW